MQATQSTSVINLCLPLAMAIPLFSLSLVSHRLFHISFTLHLIHMIFYARLPTKCFSCSSSFSHNRLLCVRRFLHHPTPPLPFRFLHTLLSHHHHRFTLSLLCIHGLFGFSVFILVVLLRSSSSFFRFSIQFHFRCAPLNST